MDIAQGQAEAIEELASGIAALDVVGIALRWEAFDRGAGVRYVWELISWSEEPAREYYASLPEDERVTEAALALAAAGWTRSAICFRLS